MEKQNRTASIFMGLMTLAFAYIIIKDVELPPLVLISALVLGGFSLLCVGMNRPEIVTYVLVAYLPFSKVLVGDFGGWATAFNLTNLLMGFILIVWLSGRSANEDAFWTSASVNFPIFLFTALGFLSVVRGSNYGSDQFWFAFTEFKRWFTPILMYFLVLNTVKDRTTIRHIVTIIMIASTVVGLMAIYDYIEVGDTSLEQARIGGIATHSNSLAAFFNYYIFLPFGFFLMNSKRSKFWLLLIPFLIQFRGIMVTFSRGGYIAFAAGLYAINFFRSKLLFFLTLVATWIIVLNPIFLPSGIRFRMSQTFTNKVSYVQMDKDVEDSVDGSTRSRIEIWKGALKMISEQPIFGVGYGLFFPLIANYWIGGFSIDAHNTYLIIAAEMGVPALVTFILIILMVTWNTFQLYRTTEDPYTKAFALGFLGGLFGLMVSNMFGSRLDSQEVSSYFWILTALMIRLRILDFKEGKVRTFIPLKLDRVGVAA